jgi:hypothetical protein
LTGLPSHRNKASKIMEKNNLVKIYIPLLDEDVECSRPTMGVPLGEDIFRVLPTNPYNINSETWKFLPDSIVRCAKKIDWQGNLIIVAIEEVKSL